MKKRRFLLIFAILLAVGVLFALQQTNALKATQYTWQSGRVPAGFDGYRIVQVSDLHDKRFGSGQNRLIRMIRDLNPDMIALTGDILDWRTMDLAPVRELLAGTAGLAPMYYVDGNHDPRSHLYGEFRALLAEYGVTVLEGYTTLARGGDTMTLAGCGYWEWFIEGLPRPADLVLYHGIEIANSQSGHGLILAGHMHGGQVALPGGRAIVSPDGRFFPEYAGGFYELGDDSTMVVSKGLGTSGLPFRLFARPEVVCVEMKLKSSEN